jgi:hypothetical protein
MSNRKISVSEKAVKGLAFFIVFASVFATLANGQKAKCKKWTYDFSEVVKYSDTALEACKSYVKEKYPSDDYKASVEATNDAETYRCSADETYIGLVYKRECDSCCNKPSRAYFNSMREPRQFLINSSCLNCSEAN